MSAIKRRNSARPIRAGEFDDSLISAQDCKDLWSAKLLAYFYDAMQPKRKSAVHLHPHIAQGWFGTSDFRATCFSAGVDPDFVMEAFRKRMEQYSAGDFRAALHGLENKKVWT